MTGMVEIDRTKLTNMGGSQYALIPRQLRSRFNTEPGDEIIWSGMPDSDDVVIRIVKKASESKVESN